MSATDELRRLLDERGVEYKHRDMFGKHVFHWGEPLHGAMFTDGGEWTELVVENASPEQAIEATLGGEAEAENTWLKEAYDYWRGMFEAEVAENAKLRELVREMMRFFEDGDWCTTCESAKECEAQEQYEEDCLMRGAFHDRMRELGIEVDG